MSIQPGVKRFESALWEGASTVVIDGANALAVDPGILPDEVVALREAVAAEGATVRDILITHGDWDHLAGLSGFPEATVWMGALSAARIESGEADAELAGDASDYGIPPGVTARVDRVLEPGVATRVGGFAVESLSVPGHRADGLAYRVRSHDVLVVGDYLSSYECPGIKYSSAAFRTTLATLIDVLENDPPALVIPGHGPAHTAAAALRDRTCRSHLCPRDQGGDPAPAPAAGTKPAPEPSPSPGREAKTRTTPNRTPRTSSATSTSSSRLNNGRQTA